MEDPPYTLNTVPGFFGIFQKDMGRQYVKANNPLTTRGLLKFRYRELGNPTSPYRYIGAALMEYHGSWLKSWGAYVHATIVLKGRVSKIPMGFLEYHQYRLRLEPHTLDTTDLLTACAPMEVGQVMGILVALFDTKTLSMTLAFTPPHFQHKDIPQPERQALRDALAKIEMTCFVPEGLEVQEQEVDVTLMAEVMLPAIMWFENAGDEVLEDDVVLNAIDRFVLEYIDDNEYEPIGDLVEVGSVD